MNTSSFSVGVVLDGTTVGLMKAAAAAKKVIVDLVDAGSAGAKKTAKDFQGSSNQMRSEFARMAQAREALGIRSERRIQQEIRQTEAAYRRLASTGEMSWGEQRRAAAKMREEVTRLNNEMGRLTTRQKLSAGFRGIGMGVAGVAAGAAVLKPKLDRAIDFDTRLRYLVNTAYGLDSNNKVTGNTERAAGYTTLTASINDAVRYGGGTRDGALDALNQFLAVNQFSAGQINGGLLRETMKASKANNVSPEILANLANKTIPGMGLSTDRVSQMYGMASFAGKLGGFELRDMAMHLPEQMPFAKMLGMRGEKDFAKILALNQAAFMTAGTPDQAGTNVKNLLEQLSQKHTADRFKKIGIDLPRMIGEGRLKGLDALDVVSGILDKQLSKNKNYKNLQRQLGDAKEGSQRKEALESMVPILQGTEIGKVIHEQRALLGLAGLLNYKDLVQKVYTMAPGAGDTHLRDFDFIKEGLGYSTEQAKNQADISNQEAMNKLTPALKVLTDKTVSLAQEYPGYTAAILGATTALTALAAAAGAAGLAGLLLPGGAAGGLLGKFAGPMGAAAKWGGGVGLAGAAGYGAGSWLSSRLEGTGTSDQIGEITARILANFGSKEAAQSVEINDQWKGGRVGGELTVRVLSDPNVAVQAEARPFNGTKMRVQSNTGRTNPEGSW